MVSAALKSFGEVVSVACEYPEVYLFLGYGERAQYASVSEVIGVLDPYLKDVQKRCGGKRWLAMYGGDKANADAPDLGLLMKQLQDGYGCDLLAVQSAGEPDTHTTFHFVCEQQFEEAHTGDKQVIYGGVRKGVPVGGSRIYLAPELIATEPGGRRILTGVFAAGGGGVAQQELVYADTVGLPWVYVPSRARFPEAYGSVYGPVHAYVESRLNAADGKQVTVIRR